MNCKNPDRQRVYHIPTDGLRGLVFIRVQGNNLFVVSSDDNFNIALIEMKPDKRRSEIKGEPPLTVVPANERKQRYFLQKFNMSDEMPEDDEEYNDDE